ncbi:hypothetical protein L1049_022738 [Liquidambar formosana]|uniref:Uncharacterized protein n=1 Tax=Liquidambar formosana TaxID=63359 RepID=A0AAP0WQP1_LIQFO
MRLQWFFRVRVFAYYACLLIPALPNFSVVGIANGGSLLIGSLEALYCCCFVLYRAGPVCKRIFGVRCLVS